MSSHSTNARFTGEVRSVVTRADGTTVDLGVVAAHYSNPLRRAWWRLVGQPRANARIRAANDRHRKTGI